jgi:hypothetical protein
MSSIEEYILNYGGLAPDERHALERYVSQHPEWAPLLEEVRLFCASVSGPEADPSVLTDDELARFVVDQHLGGAGGSIDRTRRLIEASPALQRRYDAMYRRLQTLPDVANPLTCFEALSGHDLSTEALADAPDRPPASRFGPAWRRPVGVMVLVGVLATTWLSARWRAIDQLAAPIGNEPAIADASRIVREESAEAGEASPETVLHLAQATYRHARRPGWGIFPHFDRDLLQRSEDLLRRVMGDERADARATEEARYQLALVQLARRDWAAARATLAFAAAGHGPHADEAAERLRRLGRLIPTPSLP